MRKITVNLIIKVVAISSIMFSLAGCSKSKDDLISFYKNQTGEVLSSKIVLPAGSTVEISGAKYIVSGFDACPRDGWYWGGPLDGDKCVVITKDNKLIQVMVFRKDEQSKQEEWSVTRKDGGIYLKDSSGASVMRVSHD
jgi:hypothetical protein